MDVEEVMIEVENSHEEMSWNIKNKVSHVFSITELIIKLKSSSPGRKKQAISLRVLRENLQVEGWSTQTSAKQIHDRIREKFNFVFYQRRRNYDG
jgi:hypothetical protein